MAKTYFISDLHFGHKGVLDFDRRPFDSIKEHDEYIINRWNNKIKPEDTVWILGDLSWHDTETTANIISNLNGHKNLCFGNHDSKLREEETITSLFGECCDYKEIQVGNDNIVLCHYPLVAYKNSYKGWVHLYGHVHRGYENNLVNYYKEELYNLYYKKYRMYNVGCMLPHIDYVPKTLEEIENLVGI